MKRKGHKSHAESLAMLPIDSEKCTLACSFSLLHPDQSASDNPIVGAKLNGIGVASLRKKSSKHAIDEFWEGPQLPNVMAPQVSEALVNNSLTLCGCFELGVCVRLRFSTGDRSYENEARRLQAPLRLPMCSVRDGGV